MPSIDDEQNLLDWYNSLDDAEKSALDCWLLTGDTNPLCFVSQGLLGKLHNHFHELPIFPGNQEFTLRLSQVAPTGIGQRIIAQSK